MKTVLITERTDASIGLRLAGIETICVKNIKAAESELTGAAADGNIGVLLITPGIEKMCPVIINDIRERGRPLLVGIPDADGKNESSNAISEYIQNAIGIHLD